MIVKIFGNGSELSIERKNTSIGAIEVCNGKSTNTLIEVPKDIGNLYKQDKRFAENLDYTIITHAHHDHYGDLEGLLTRKEFIEEKDLTVILPEKVEIPVYFLDDYKPKHVKILHTNHYEDENIIVEFFPVDHPGIPTYGIKLYYKRTKKWLGYSSDTKKPVVEKLKDCDIILHDCAGGLYHTSEEEVYNESTRNLALEKTLCIHVNDDFEPEKLKLAKDNISV